jgi:succinate dehydrogenase / fumarate reductase cytochrome b subunit
MPQRPISPHLQVYRLPFTAVLSICHRITGALLSFGLILLVALLLSALLGEHTYEWIRGLLASIPGQVLLWGYIFALVFHTCHGVRHLIWDSLRGLERATLFRHNLIELVVAFLATALLFVFTQGLVGGSP